MSRSDTVTGDAPDVVARRPLTWSRVLVLAPAGIAGMFGLLMLVFGPDPQLVTFTLVLAALALLARRFPVRVGPGVVLVGSAVFLVSNVGYVVTSLAHPETPLAFNTALVSLLLAVLSGVAAVAILTSWSSTRVRPVVAVAAGVALAGAVLSQVANALVRDDVALPEDVRVVTGGLAFDPEELVVEASGAVHVSNHSATRHTFTVRDLGIDVELPANTARRIALDGAPGTYRLVCAVPGHEAMTATVVLR